MIKLSEFEKALSPDDQAGILKAKQDYASAKNVAEREKAHRRAEEIRSKYNFSGGGAGDRYIVLNGGKGKASAPQNDASGRPGDYSGFIREMSEEALKIQMKALEAAHAASLEELEARKERIAPLYYDAANALSASTLQSARRFGEYAAANGLSSGAATQMNISRQGALQSGLAGIRRDEAQAYGDIENERSRLAAEYQYRIADARAQGRYKLAEALYNEAVRLDKAMLEYAANEKDYAYKLGLLDYQKEQDRLDREYQERLFEYNRLQDETENRMKEAALTGYYDGKQTLGAVKAGASAAKKSSSAGVSKKAKKEGVYTDTQIKTAEKNAKAGYFDDDTLDALLWKYGKELFLKRYGDAYFNYLDAAKDMRAKAAQYYY